MLCIEELLRKQRDLQNAMGNPINQTGDINIGVKENMLALIVEATEVLNEVNWKPWKPKHRHKVINKTALITELTDCLQFVANAINEAGFSAEHVEVALRSKWVENHERIKNGEVTRADS